MSHRGEATQYGVYACTKKEYVCVCARVSVSIHVQACVCLCLVLGVTGGRYAMSWLTRVLLCCSVLHD